MRLLKNNLNATQDHNNIMFLCASSNEDNSSGDINDMGKNLANEIKFYINESHAEHSIQKYFNIILIFFFFFLIKE